MHLDAACAAPAPPAIVMVAPQMGENIGAAARVMANFGLSDLRLVRPRDPWPNEKAVAMAAGADAVLAGVRVFETLEAAAGDLHRLFATTDRARTLAKPIISPRAAAAAWASGARSLRTGFVFGSERFGLFNDEIALCDAIVTIPTAPDATSLNLAQAVGVLAYEIHRAGGAPPAAADTEPRDAPATKDEMFAFFTHLEAELDAAGFLYPPEKRPAMVRNLRTLFTRAAPSQPEVQALRGIIVALSRGRPSHRRSDP